jgi:transposase
VNPAQVKALAGRKSDGRDAQRIAEYLQDGRLDGSFVPSAEVRQLRMMLRHRVALLEQRNEVHNQIRDLFETASLKLSSVITDLMGVTGRNIVEALIAGEDSPERLSWKVRGSVRKKEKLVKEALKGYFNDFHRSMLASHYKHYQFLTAEVAVLEERIAKAMEPYAHQVELLVTRLGIDRMIAWHLLAELGIDLQAFPDATHCCSWAGLVPGENESAGKQKSSRCRKGIEPCVALLLSQLGRFHIARRDTCARSFIASKPDEDGLKRLLLRAINCSRSLSKCSKLIRPIRNWEETTFDRINPVRTVRKLVERLEALDHQVRLSPVESNA